MSRSSLKTPEFGRSGIGCGCAISWVVSAIEKQTGRKQNFFDTFTDYAIGTGADKRNCGRGAGGRLRLFHARSSRGEVAFSPEMTGDD
jgi:hypothetical protein